MKISQWTTLTALTLWVGLASAAGTQGQRFGDWGTQCEVAPDNSQVCYLQQVLSEKGKKEPLMVTVIGYGKGKPFPTAIFELPKNTNIKQGIQLKLDKNEAVGFSGACDRQGCRAGFTLDNKMFQQFTRGQRALVAYQVHGKKEPVILPVSLRGLAHGLKIVK